MGDLRTALPLLIIHPDFPWTYGDGPDWEPALALPALRRIEAAADQTRCSGGGVFVVPFAPLHMISALTGPEGSSLAALLRGARIAPHLDCLAARQWVREAIGSATPLTAGGFWLDRCVASVITGCRATVDPALGMPQPSKL